MDNLEQNKQSTAIGALMLVQALVMRELCRINPESSKRLTDGLKGYLAYTAELLEKDTSRATYDGEMTVLRSLIQPMIDAIEFPEAPTTDAQTGKGAE